MYNTRVCIGHHILWFDWTRKERALYAVFLVHTRYFNRFSLVSFGKMPKQPWTNSGDYQFIQGCKVYRVRVVNILWMVLVFALVSTGTFPDMAFPVEIWLQSRTYKFALRCFGGLLELVLSLCTLCWLSLPRSLTCTICIISKWYQGSHIFHCSYR